MAEAPPIELGFREFLRIVRRRRVVVASSIALALAIAIGTSLAQSDVYGGTARVLLRPRLTEGLFEPLTAQRPDPARTLETEMNLITGQGVRNEVRRRIGDAPEVRTRPVGSTDIIAISARSPDPDRAALVADTYAHAYIDIRRRQAVDDLLDAGSELQSKLTELQREIDSAPRERRDALIDQQTLFKQKLDQLQVDAALKNGGATLVASATASNSPVEPKPVRRSVMAVIVGLIGGLGLALLRDHLDDSVNSKQDAEASSGGRPVLGMIPTLVAWKATNEAQVVSIADPRSPAAEAYRTLRTGIQFLGLDSPVRVLQITSANANEGKTTTLANLAVALAKAGQPVVMVCCDLRRPRLHQFFQLANEPGFTSVLIGASPLADAVQPVPGVPDLFLLASGPEAPNPSELLSTRRASDVLRPLTEQGHMVLIDSPPVLPVTDALVLSGKVDATLVVVRAGSTSRPDLARATELLEQVGAPLVGTVLNRVRVPERYAYEYEYYRIEPPSEGDRSTTRVAR